MLDNFLNTVICGDCLVYLPQIPEKSIDIILSDLPYQMTSRNEWDKIINPEKLWTEYRRIIKNNGTIVLTTYGFFGAKMIMSAPDLYKYTLIWEKNKVRGYLNAKKQPMRVHEEIQVFYRNQPIYNPQMTQSTEAVHAYTRRTSSTNYNEVPEYSGGGSYERYPTSIIKIPVVNNDSPDKFHPTQKPVALGEYLLRTYSNEGCAVLDNCCGSGSFLVAAKNTNRNYIGIDISAEYVEIAKRRLSGDYIITAPGHLYQKHTDLFS